MEKVPQTSRELAFRLLQEPDIIKQIPLIDAWVRVREAKLRKALQHSSSCYLGPGNCVECDEGRGLI